MPQFCRCCVGTHSLTRWLRRRRTARLAARRCRRWRLRCDPHPLALEAGASTRLLRQVRSRDTIALYGSCPMWQVRALAASVEALLKSMGGHVASACELHPPAEHPTPAPRQSGGGAPRYDNVGLAQARGHNLSSVDSSAVINRFIILICRLIICNLFTHHLCVIWTAQMPAHGSCRPPDAPRGRDRSAGPDAEQAMDE